MESDDVTTKTRLLLATTLAILLGACTGAPYTQRVNERQAAYAAAAGAPVRSFRYSSLYTWEPLGDTELVVYTRPNEAWLLDLGGCHELEFVNAIGLTSNLGQVMVGFDKVLTGARNFPCTITRIRPVDVKRLKVAQQEQRQIDSKARSKDQPAGSP
ncbi:hypothetical protein RHOFW510R12_26185 [Rhodanobacter sp. FW510-R12]|uniref:DUF6491 family protein n=1 Tax=unclassified Rhodanobacter TaxID=2621553 RepID=UPI0007AA0CC5|nr:MULTISPECIES: DUF6491 family protein [unclassified Rhodanobacter]KZC17373.1 hypothetical protein RHOFW104R8_11170 [Rhodanobacter sp. FW104-R8]KZC27938.1 hypothetical protein RhoFW510T8_13945 [Rhodanobacter sp. FW510-T8]KZC32125.1 hypothetical protein RhoFW510R10_14650 [Rhodanobacter sp. FW510-R10]